MVRLKEIVEVCAFILAGITIALRVPSSPQIPLSLPQQNSAETVSFKWPSDWTLGSLANTSFHDSYHPLSETNQFLYTLARTYPENVLLEVVGFSSEGRKIIAASIKRPKMKKKKNKLKKKPRFVIMGTQHAREWIATSTALYLSHALLADANDPWSITGLLDHFDFYVIPVPNPDGYQYTWDVDRFWYKNRMPIENTECRGIDMNRNWGFSWEPSSSPNEGPCQDWYPGTQAHEAPEVKALADYFDRLRDIKAFIDLRSYGQMVSTPYSYSCGVVPPDGEDMLEAAHGVAAALRLVHGTPMKAGLLCEMLYPAPGNILDWMYAKKDVKYSYAIHLRDTGTYGYSLPSQWIRPTGEETASSVSYVVEFMCQRVEKAECDV